MSNWKDEKTKVKDIFDSIRNYSLTGLVFYLGITFFYKSPSAGFMDYLNYITAISMLLLSIYLFCINTVSFNNIIKQEYHSGNVSVLMYLLIPGVLFMFGSNVFFLQSSSLAEENSTTLESSPIKDPSLLILDEKSPNKSLKQDK